MRVLSDDDDPPTSPLFKRAHAPIHQHRQSPCREEAPPVPLVPDAPPHSRVLTLLTLNAMEPFSKAKALVGWLPESIPEASTTDAIHDIGGIDPLNYAKFCCTSDLAEDWEQLDKVFNCFFQGVSIDTLAQEIRQGKGGVDGLLNVLEWFTVH